ncbi:MAG: tetratricopeptide repeat protein [Phycisphaerae bacterium]|nr:tetratricopeptide repeat protein [Phycisphaerae bacterium]
MLRTSVKTSLHDLRQSIASRWQMPLLAVSIVLLAVAFFRVQPPAVIPSFQQQMDQIAALQKGGFLSEASQMIQGLLMDQGRPKDERGRLHQAMAETIYLAEEPLRHHDPENIKRIIRNHRRAMAQGTAATAQMHEQMGYAFTWLSNPDEAVDEFRKAIEAGSENTARLRREIVEILRGVQRSSPQLLTEQVMAMLADEKVDPNDLLWAAEQRIELYSQENKHEEIHVLIEKIGPRLTQAGLAPQLAYLEAKMNSLTGDYAEAERILLGLQSKLDTHSDLAARVRWLLGRVHFSDGRPQEALSVFQDLVQVQPSGEFYLAGRLGMAECLAALHHIDEAAAIYEEVAGAAARYAGSQIVDRDAVRASLTSLYAMLRTQGRLEAAARFLRLATSLVPAGNEEMEAFYLRNLADLYVSIGDERVVRAEADAAKPDTTFPTTGPAASTQPRPYDAAMATAHDAFRDAAETYLRLSRVLLMKPEASGEEQWKAAVQFDRANLPERSIAVFQDFLQAHSKSTRVPDVLRRLGQAHQSLGQFKQAIARYEENQQRFPRTPAAMRSLVPMAQCLMALGPSHYGQAEKTLLTIIDQPSKEGRYDPEALEYREALFVMADLYDRWDKPEKAVSRLEEILERYPRDPRIARAQFVLANSFRKSALEILASPDASTQQSGALSVATGAERLKRAEELYSEVIHTLEGRRPNSLKPIETLYLKYSHLCRADCAFDLKEYDRAMSLYEEAARRFRRDPVSLSAYVQILNCYQRMGKDAEARAAVQRVKWLLKGIPEERFDTLPGRQSLAYWEGFFKWVEDSKAFEP